MIYSPEVPVFRLDDGTWIDRYNISIVTSPAVNAGVVRSRIHRKDVDKQINEAMYERMARILQLFELKRIPILILGSFGTGVFKNDPELVAKAWSELLSGRFKNSFKHVVMAIKDYKTFSTFQKHFLIK
ncbi:hypothetical protein AKO1_007769 [Acrasis kona]|uniref:Microbial-type PARG catalytic domain-containing protein n=1 Tax=Acrasis kona TaxID=1008807 RepID=A0AAW2YSB0_9EUKA